MFGSNGSRIVPFCNTSLDAGAIVDLVVKAVALQRLRSDGPFRYSDLFRP